MIALPARKNGRVESDCARSTSSAASASAEETSALDPSASVANETSVGCPVNASAWTIGGDVACQVLRLANSVVLSHLLVSRDFGLMAIVNAFLIGVQMCCDLGVGQCIIQDRDSRRPEFYNTAWTLQAVRGLALWIVLLALAAPVAAYYREPQLALLLAVAGLTLPLGGVISTAVYSHRRDLKLVAITTIDVASQLAGVLVMWAVAWWTRSAWALVIGSVVASALLVVSSHFIDPTIRNRLHWEPVAARRLIHFGVWIFAGMIVAFLSMHFDKLMLPNLIGLALFGVYNMAWQISALAGMTLEKLAASVQFPILARSYWNDRAALPTQLLSSRSHLLGVGLPLTLAVFAVAPPLFRYVYGADFINAGQIAQWLCLPMWVLLLSRTADRVLLAAGQTRELTLASTVRFVASAPLGLGGLLLGQQLGTIETHGIPGFCMGLAAGALISHGVLYFLLRKLDIRIGRQDAVFTAVFLLGIGAVLALQQLGGSQFVGEALGLLAPLAIGGWSLRGSWQMLRRRFIGNSMVAAEGVS